MSHLLVTADFPPKVGGIQSYLWELWRRLPPSEFAVLTTSHPNAPAFDSSSGVKTRRTRSPVMLPSPSLVRGVNDMARSIGASLVVIDPALPLGLIGPHLDLPYALVLHGAEVTVPGRLPGSRAVLSHVLQRACAVIAAGPYPAAEARRAVRGELAPTVTVVPPGVDTAAFHPYSDAARAQARIHFALPPKAPLIVSVSRLVPRKGMDTLIQAAADLRQRYPELVVAISGGGRDQSRLAGLIAKSHAPVRLLGRVATEDLPALYGCADLFVMACRNRWANLEQEGFGIVFLEAAAAGVAQVAGNSGGAADAVVDGLTGLVLDSARPRSLADALGRLLADDAGRAEMGAQARRRAEADFDYNILAHRLSQALSLAGG
ncbi:MAG: glycosyltransferase family 4 protein [Acidimicrobiales bacterium]